MKNWYIYGCVWICCLLGCKLTDINIDPNRQTDTSLKELLPAAMAQTLRNTTSLGNRVTGAVIQHYKGVDAQPEGYSNYLIDERTLNSLWESGLYVGALRDCELIIKQSEVGDYQGIAKILTAVNLGILTSYWGDIPFSFAFQPDIYPKATYDSQEEIYYHIQRLLNEAIEDLEVPSASAVAGEDDLIFQGENDRWIKTAYALKARYAIQVSKRDILSAEKALSFLQGAFQELGDQPNFPFRATLNEGQPFALFGIERPDQLVLGEHLQSLLVNTNDPRLNIYCAFQDQSYLLFQTDNRDLFWAQLDAPVPIISLAEVLFIKAEAQLRTGNIDEAEFTFKQAVETHFIQLDMLSGGISEFVDKQIHFDDCFDYEAKLKKIITQKYIALYVQGTNEAWVDYRRTGYPELVPPSNANTSFNPSGIVPRRYLYPISERLTNTQNLQAAIDLQSGHLMDNDLWIFK